MGVEAPSGTVTFLFTDIEGSTRLWEEDRNTMAQSLARHDEILRGAIASHDGVVFSTGGDGLAAAFQRAPDAVGAALDAQARLQAERWERPISVRMAVHTGDVEDRDGDYFGPPLNRCARLMASGHGGQILCSGVSASLVADRLPTGATLHDLGSHHLRDLSEPELVFQLEHSDLRKGFPPLRSLDHYRGNLSAQPTTFVGREAEVARVAKSLSEARIVTLSGVGGVGKTRLALQVGAQLLPQFPDGVWVVELASIGTADAVDDAVASALGIQPAPGGSLEQSLHDHLRNKTLLLILDNCEHLLGAVATFLDGALRTAPSLSVLATSREGLALAGERLMTVPSLEMPSADMAMEDLLVTEAVRLFVSRAEEVHSTFDASDGNAHAVGELCRRLDGIPLAIELAAARVRVMTPNEILENLDRRFKLLTAGRRTAATRHQTLQGTLDWSHDLLDETEKVVFRRLSVFTGDFDRSVAEAVLADDELDSYEVADALFKLVEKSLVVAQPVSDTTRYRLLETIRDYAWDRLTQGNESDELSKRHCSVYLALAEELGPQLCDAREMEAKAHILTELENLRAALRYAIGADDAETALRLVVALSIVGSLRSPFGVLPLEAAQMTGAQGHPRTPVAVASAAAAISAQGDHHRAADLAGRAVVSSATGDDSELRDRVRCRVFSNAAMVIQHDQTMAIEMARSWLVAARRIDDPFEICEALTLLAGFVLDFDEGLQACEEALPIARELGSPSRIAYVLLVLGGRVGEVDVDRAEAAFAEGLAAARVAKNDWVDSFFASQLAVLQARKGDIRASAATLLDSAERADTKGDQFAVALGLTYLAAILANLGDVETATLLVAWSERHGTSFALSNPQLGHLSDELNERWEGLSEPERVRLLERAAGFDAREIFDIVHQRLDSPRN